MAHPSRVGKEPRRLAAVLVADVVGYSALMGADELGTLRALKACHREIISPSVDAHGGRIVKTTGDGVLAEFPSAVDAVSCAIVCQKALAAGDSGSTKSLVLRIGINVGDIIIDDDDIFGDGVNIAARLQSMCEPGGICVSRAVRDHVRDKVPVAFTDLGEQHVKNIARPVRAFGIRPSAIAAAPDVKPRTDARTTRKLAIVLVPTVIAVSLIGVAGWLLTRPHKTEVAESKTVAGVILPATRASIAIMPFASLDGDGQGDYFADGLTEDIIAALGRFRDLLVISRGAVFSYKGKNISPAQLGRDLNVRYVVEGTVRRTPDLIRVSLSLNDTGRNAVLWSARHDARPEDIFSIQDQITRRISSAIALRVTNLELAASAAKPPDRLEAYDLVLRGRDLLRRLTRSSNAEARRLFERAIEVDPKYAPAYVGLGRVNRFAGVQGWAPPKEAFELAESFARKAIELDDSDPGAHALLGQVLVQFGQHDSALHELQRALELNASDIDAYAGLLAVLLWRGETKEAIAAGEFLTQIEPELSVPNAFHLGTAYLLADRGSDAIRILQQSLSRNPGIPQTRIILAAAYADVGQQSEAEKQASIVRERFPWFSSQEFGSLLRDQRQRERLSAALTKAGL